MKLAKMLVILSFIPFVWAQMVHRGVFLTDITNQLPLEALGEGRILSASATGQETILLVKDGNTAAFYRQTTGNSRFALLVADNDPRIKGKFVYQPLNNRPDVIARTNYEHSPYGLGFVASTNSTQESPLSQNSAYFIKGSSTTLEPVAVAGETVMATVLVPLVGGGQIIGYNEITDSINIERAGKPSVSADGALKYIYIGAKQASGNQRRDGVYAISGDRKFKQLINTTYPTPYTIRDNFGIFEKEGHLWFVEDYYDGSTQSSSTYISSFNLATGEKKRLYKIGAPILGEEAQSINFYCNADKRELYALTGFYDFGIQRRKERIVALDLSPLSDQIFQPFFRIPGEFPDGTKIFTNGLEGISRNMAIISSVVKWHIRDNLYLEEDEVATSLWNGENFFAFLKEGDQLADGKQIEKLAFRWYTSTLELATVVGCEGTIFSFDPKGAVQYWLKVNIPCIQQAPSLVRSGEEIVLKGQNLSVSASLVDVVATDDLGKETVITPTRISPTEVAFLAPLVAEAKVFKVRVRQNQSGGPVISNAVSVQVNPLPVPPPEISGIVNGASFDTNQPLAAGTIFSLFGKNLGTAEQAKGFPLPRNLGGAKVSICGTDAPLLYNSGPMTRTDGGGQLWQINGVVPNTAYGQSSCEVTVSVDQKPPTAVFTAKGKVNFSSEVEKTLAIFTFTGFYPNEAQTQEPIITNQQGQLIAPPSVSIPGVDSATFTQARACEVVTLWTTGGGTTIPPVADGEPAPSAPLAWLEKIPVIQIYGMDAEVLFAGRAPGFAGLDQINVRVPCEATPGEQWLWFGRLPNPGNPVYKIWVQ